MGIYDNEIQTIENVVETTKPKKDKKEKKPWSKKKKVLTSIIAIVLVIALAATGLFLGAKQKASSSYSYIRTTTLSRGTLEDSFSSTGTVESSKTSNVTTSLSYTVKTVLVSVGDEVKEGDVIATLDTTDLEKQIEREKKNVSTAKSQAQSSYNSAKKSYDKAKESLKEAKAELKKAKTEQTTQTTQTTIAAQNIQDSQATVQTASVSTSDTSSTSSYTQAKQAVEQAETALDQAEEQLSQAKIQLENAGSSDTLEELQEQLANCKLKAGQDGTITALNATVGSAAGSSSGMGGSSAVATISDLSSLKISITIAEANINKATIGMKCEITSDASDETIDGTLTQIDPVAGDSGSFGAEVTVDTKTTSLKVGMNASVSIIISSKDNVFQVPIDAVGNDDTGDFVYKYKSGEGTDMEFDKVYVTKGESNDYYIEIFSDDLTEGDVVRSTADLTQGIESGEKTSSSDSNSIFSLFGSGGGNKPSDMPSGGNFPSGNSSDRPSMPSGGQMPS